MSIPAIVVGVGGHARVLIDALRLNKVQILGVTDAAPEKIDQAKINLPVLGKDEVISKHSPRDVLLVNGLGQVNVNPRRADLFTSFKEKGYTFATVIHPNVIIASGVRLGEGVQIMAGVIIQTGSVIGANTIINTGASVDHDCIIGPHVHLAPGVILSGSVVVGEGSHLGTGAVVVNNVQIEKNSFIKANTLVSH